MKWGRAIWISTLTLIVGLLILSQAAAVGGQNPLVEDVFALLVVVALPALAAWYFFRSVDPTPIRGFCFGMWFFLIPLICVAFGWFMFATVIGAAPGLAIAFVIGVFTGGDKGLQLNALTTLAPFIVPPIVTTAVAALLRRKRGLVLSN